MLPATSQPIRNEQELLARFVQTAQAMISEFSADHESDEAALIEIVTEYAEDHDLRVEREWFDSFYFTYPERRRA